MLYFDNNLLTKPYVWWCSFCTILYSINYIGCTSKFRLVVFISGNLEFCLKFYPVLVDIEQFALSDRSSEGGVVPRDMLWGSTQVFRRSGHTGSPQTLPGTILWALLPSALLVCFRILTRWWCPAMQNAMKSDKEDENGWILSPWKNLSPNNSSNQYPFFKNFTQDLPASR